MTQIRVSDIVRYMIILTSVTYFMPGFQLRDREMSD